MRAYVDKKTLICTIHLLQVDILICDTSCREEVRAPRTTLKYAQALSSTYVIY